MISPACRSKTAGNSPTDSCRVTILSEALGARSVLIGRPLFWGLAVDSESGALAALEMLLDELDATMLICGRATIDSIDMDTLTTVSPFLSLFPHHADFR